MDVKSTISAPLRGELRKHFDARLEWQKAQCLSPVEIGTTRAALEALDSDSVHPVIGALLCDIASPTCMPLHAEKAAQLREQLLDELDKTEQARA